MNIPHQNANKILSFFQHIGKDFHVLRSMKMGTKCKNVITNVLSKIETKHVVDNIQNTKFSIFIDETFDICNEKWMTFQVRYLDPETLDTHTQLVVLINIDAKDSSAEKLFNAFKKEMYKLQISFLNIISLLCDNASVMIRKHVSKPRLLTFPCPCHSAALAAHAASDKIPEVCDQFINFFNQFNAYFHASQTRIHVLHSKCLQFLYNICRNFLKENQKNLYERKESCESVGRNKYLNKLKMHEHEDVVTTVRRPNKVTKYSNLTNLLNAVRSLPNSNADPERMFSLLSNVKNKKRNKLSSTTVNACVFKLALKEREEKHT
ncbi:hypothetical protein ALC56_07576 [Trachymyrmex septentrionalis]|uniref:HAT C-terminal dimerisation domain-containing protein n=1 Tax=Trachymyrmex septentrionalis TaxID=34720 RepID=A0A151JVX1_9HYME|nr:hypothetical protein ALC56_07576 [Trachymyrmex septentrionalis]